MAREVAILNQYDARFPAQDKYEKKYFKCVGSVGKANPGLLAAFQSGRIEEVEQAIKAATNAIKTQILLIGLACVIIDREKLYETAGYNSYFEYAVHLYEETGLSPQSISAAKIIIERFLDYRSDLAKHGFVLERNSNKLLLLETALKNHQNHNEVFRRITGDTFRDFQMYARTPDGQRQLPPPQPTIEIDGNKVLVDGKNILNFPPDLPSSEKAALRHYLTEVYAIRAAGNAPIIVEAYDEREARVLRNRIEALTKEIRASR